MGIEQLLAENTAATIENTATLRALIEAMTTESPPTQVHQEIRVASARDLPTQDTGRSPAAAASATAEPAAKAAPSTPPTAATAASPGKPAQPSEASSAPTPDAAKKATQDDVRSALRAYAAIEGEAAAIAILTAHDSKSISALDEKRYASVIAACRTENPLD